MMRALLIVAGAQALVPTLPMRYSRRPTALAGLKLEGDAKKAMTEVREKIGVREDGDFYDLDASVGGAQLYARSQPTALGEVDAFVSHSWHDDGAAKLRALRLWAEEASDCPMEAALDGRARPSHQCSERMALRA